MQFMFKTIRYFNGACVYLVVFNGVVTQAVSLSKALKDLMGIMVWIHTGKDR